MADTEEQVLVDSHQKPLDSAAQVQHVLAAVFKGGNATLVDDAK